jgi:diguanylate cyclase (GGDEF)-like protein/PAS domain S-box-containing protein
MQDLPVRGGAATLAAETVRRLHETLSHLNAAKDLYNALQEICDALCDLLGCRLVTMNLVEGDLVRVVGVAGHDAGHQLLWAASPVSQWQSLISTAERWGQLRFVRDSRDFVAGLALATASTEVELYGDASTWGTLNMLLAPLVAADAELVGVITLDVEAGKPLPDELMLTVLEMFTMQAGVAIQQHRLSQASAADHRALRLSEQRYRLAFDNAPIGMAEILCEGEHASLVRVNRATGQMFGIDPDGVEGKPVDEVLVVASGDGLDESISAMVGHGGKPIRLELPFIRTDGSKFWGRVEAAPLPDASGACSVLCQIVDITSTKATERELTRLAHFDSLTGLPNRAVLLDRLADVVIEARRTGVPGALLFCDIDSFKLINDRFGHLAGDTVLAKLASRLRSVVRRGDTAGRFGGDELVVVAHPMTRETAELLAARVAESLGEPITMGDATVSTGVSVGVAVIDGTQDAIEVLGQADLAMYDGRAALRRSRHDGARNLSADPQRSVG